MIGGGAVLRGSFEDLTAKTTLADAHSPKMTLLPRRTLSQETQALPRCMLSQDAHI